MRTSDLLNVISFLHALYAEAGAKQMFSRLHELGGDQERVPALVGDSYYKAKEHLISAEQVLMRVIRFQVTADHPHKHVMRICSELNTTSGMLRSSICLLNDCLTYTSLSVSMKPEILACGAVHLMLNLIQGTMPSQEWWSQFCVTRAEMEHAGHKLMDMVVEVLAQGE